jgi:hypothetical protein
MRNANYNKFISDEYEKFYISSELGDIEQSWIYLQRIHIVSQSILVDHLKSHLNMLFYAVKTGDIKEIFGQVLRLMLAPIGNFLRRIPAGNRGTSDVSPFLRETIPNDLKEFIK